MLSSSDLLHLKRNPDSHKGDNGRVLIIGGSQEYVGAPALAGLAALRAGCDIVVIAAPENVAYAINTYSPNLITHKLKGDFVGIRHFPSLIKMAEDFDCILIGPGLKGIGLSQLIYKLEMPLVLDAGAFHNLDIMKIDKCILTPHRKEFELLLKNSNLTEGNFQHHLEENIIVLKGRQDKIISSKEVKTNSTGNAGMTVGGTGDVLAGVIASLVAQSKQKYKSAVTGAYVTGKAGDLAYKEKGNSLVATDVIAMLPVVMRKISV